MVTSRPLSTPSARRRQLAVATVALAVASFCHGLTMPLLSLVLNRQGVDETLIGLNTGVYFIAIFAVAPFASRLMRTRGPALLMLASILAMTALFILLRVFPNVWLWFPLRFGLGVAASFLWIAGEAWVNHAVDEAHRGRVIAIFGVVVSAGFALGPAILSWTGAEGWAPFLVTSSLLLAAAAVLASALGSAPRLRGKTSGPLARYVLLAPVAMFGYFAFAAGDAVLLTFLPIYAVEIGRAEADAVRLLTVLAIGSMALQYPIGWLADRIDNRALVAAVALALLAGSAALPWVLPHAVSAVVFMFFYGGALGALYTLSLVLLGRQFKGADLGAASAMLSVMFCIGAFIWPPLGGAIMERIGERAMPVSLVIAYASFLPIVLVAWLRGVAPRVRVYTPCCYRKEEKNRTMSVSPEQEGGCQCGAIRYRLLRAPVALYVCHCRDCQKQASSAFGMSMWVERDAIEFRGAEPRIYHTRGGSGRPKHCAFCGECGTRLYHAGGDERDVLSVKAGSLDDTSGLAPTCHLWTKSAQPWTAPVREGAVCYEAEPDGDEVLRAQWRDRCM